MPSASYSPRRPVKVLDEATAMLREAGLRVSTSRRVVLEGLLSAEGPVSAEVLARGRGGPKARFDLPSTYRNLELFERLGMVRHVHIGHGPGLYALVGESDPTYLVCESCGRLGRLPGTNVAEIRTGILDATGFQAHFSHFPILGLCDRCADHEARSDAREGATIHHGDPEEHEHAHDDSHAHEHSHGEETHTHTHDDHDHDHVKHEHEHSHGDRVHEHPHVHQEGLEDQHAHSHDD